MVDAAVIRGTFASVRPVAGRKVWQFVIEVPAEEANAALQTLGGLPSPEESRWVAVALLNPTSSTKAAQTPAPLGTDTPPAGERHRDSPATKSLAQRAAILTHDKAFWGWIGQTAGHGVNAVPNSDAADHAMKRYLVIKSKRELDADAALGRDFREMERQFLHDVGRIR